DTGTRLIAFRRRLKCQGANARCCSLRNWDCDVGSRMRDALDREATPEGIEEVERLLKATTAEIVPLPKSRPVPKTSTEVLAMPTVPALSVACHSAREPSPIRRSDPMSQFHDQSPTVEAALQYAGRGLAVLPMRGKKFYTRDGVRIATHDPNIIKQWGWAEGFGMACGEPSRTDVFDIDDAEAFAAAGFDVDALAASTLAATTPSGGRHLFFEFAGLRNRAFPWGEWRSTGLAVVLPPAPGRKWLNDLTPQPVPSKLIIEW